MEIEAKFVLPDAEVLERLLAVDHLAEFALTGKQVKQVKDTYLDTPDRLILAAGFACRQREKDDSVLITLKGLGRAEDGIHRREEYEVLLPACAPLTKWPAGPVRDRVHELVGDAHLVPLFHIEQTRILRQVSQDERVVGELSLDDVLTTAQGKEQGFLELEVELALQGTEEDLKALVACLQDEWKLEPMVLSKFERGLAFLDATQLRERLLTTSASLTAQCDAGSFCSGTSAWTSFPPLSWPRRCLHPCPHCRRWKSHQNPGRWKSCLTYTASIGFTPAL
jgi:inorganic triphosphatase YgiF